MNIQHSTNNNKYPTPASVNHSRNKLNIGYSFLFLFVFLISSCENDLREIESVATSDELKYETMKNVELLYSDSAIVRVKVMGDKMFRYLDINAPRQEFPEGIQVDFFDPSGRTQSELTAKYALRFEKKNARNLSKLLAQERLFMVMVLKQIRILRVGK